MRVLSRVAEVICLGSRMEKGEWEMEPEGQEILGRKVLQNGLII